MPTATNWKEQWKSMPEFVQEKEQPFSKIIVRFETENDLKRFAKLLGVKVTAKTKSLWFPPKGRDAKTVLRYVDES
jgi:hypothetical protein